METYFGTFCPLADRELLRDADLSTLRVDRYEGVNDLARGSLTGDAAWHLWNVMFTGCGVVPRRGRVAEYGGKNAACA